MCRIPASTGLAADWIKLGLGGAASVKVSGIVATPNLATVPRNTNSIHDLPAVSGPAGHTAPVSVPPISGHSRRRARRKQVCDVAGIGHRERFVSELLGYLERNQAALVHYAARRRRGEPISTAFVERGAVAEIMAKRMNKKQQMRWNRTTVQPFPDVRTAVRNDMLEDAFLYRYPRLNGPRTTTR